MLLFLTHQTEGEKAESKRGGVQVPHEIVNQYCDDFANVANNGKICCAEL